MANTGSTIGSLLGTGLGGLIGLLGGPAGFTVGAGLGNTLGGGIGSLFNTTDYAPAPTLLNAADVAQWRSQLGNYLGNAQNQMKSYLAQGNQFQGQASNLLNQLSNFKSNVQYSPTAYMGAFNSLAPQMQQVARGTVGSGAADEDMKLLQAQALRDVAGQFGGGAMDSGAFQSQAIQAMAQPRYQAAMQTQSLQSQAATSLLGQLQQALASGYQNQANVGLQKEQMGLSALSGAASGFSDLTNQALQAAGIFSQQGNVAMSGLGQLNEPVYYSPSIIQNGGNDMGASINNILALLAQSGVLNPGANLGQETGNFAPSLYPQPASFYGNAPFTSNDLLINP